MGCSPSKGKLFSKSEGSRPQNDPSAGASLSAAESKPVEEDNKCLKSDDKENELPLSTEEHTEGNKTSAQSAEDIKKMEVNVMPQETVGEVIQTGKVKNTEKRKRNKEKQKSFEKQRKSSSIQTKVDFPPYMVRAHQAAYDFLGPNISKYETLLSLLDQAAQTQLSLQPMMSALVLRFEEINQALEEMAEEGEQMLKEHGDYMALPSGMMSSAIMPVKPSTDTSKLDPPPDLLQQLLQHSAEKMRLVGGSVQALGDTTLEEAVEYFSSLSKLLVEKLQAKQAVDKRLTQVLARVEVAAMRKANPEDTALHSEDSGIGGENESLTGSEKHRRHRGSAGSGSCGSGVNIRGTFDPLPNILPNLVGHNEDDEEDEEEEEEEDNEEYEDDEDERVGRKRSNSSPPDPSQPLLHMHAAYMQSTSNRPQTAVTSGKPECSSSTRCVNIMMELQKSQRNLDERMKMANVKSKKDLAGLHYNIYRSGLRRHSLSSSRGLQKGPFRTDTSPGSLPMFAPHPPKRNSVRRLINTFSQGVDGRPGQSLDNIPPHIRRPRKSGSLLLSEVVNTDGGVLVNNGNNNNNSWPDGKDDLDVDSLPPPPPEVLMDNSFQSTEGMPRNDGSHGDSVGILPMIQRKTGVSQRLRACVQNVNVLPNRASVQPRLVSTSAAHPFSPDAVLGARDAEQHSETDLEKADCLYQQARKIIHLRNAAESADKRKAADQNGRGLSPLRARTDQRFETNEHGEGEAEVSPSSLPWTAPPVSRVRLPPSNTITVHHRFPKPPVVKPSSRPSSPSTVAVSNTEEIVPSVSFRDARSVFCQREAQNPQTWTSSGHSVLPRPWGEVTRGRLTTRGMVNTGRRTQSEQRPGNSTSSQAKDHDTATAKHRLSNPVMTEDDARLDPSAA